MARAAAARTAPGRAAPARRHPAHRRPVEPTRKPARRASGHGKVRAAVKPGGARILDAMLHGRSWIALVGVLLAGIVFFNVDLLQMNREITRVAERAAEVKRENARLRLDVARLASSERIQETAVGLGLVLPAPGQVRYLKSRPLLDATHAAKRMTAPNLAYVAPAPVTTVPDPALPTTDPTLTGDQAATIPPATTDPTTTPPITATPPATATTTPPGTPPATAVVE